ncbi:MAG: hypothetical protein AAF718_05065 [Pseudomonadota bacterium]
MDDAFFQQFLKSILRKDLSEIARVVAIPLIVYSRESVVVIQSFPEALTWLAEDTSFLGRLEIETASASIIDRSDVSTSMSSFLVKQHYWAQKNTPIGFVSCRYFIRTSERGVLIEMVERL